MTDSVVTKPFRRIVRALTLVEPNELRATFLSFLFIFLLFAAYFMVRPARDAMASDWSRIETSWLWTMTFVGSVAAVAIYGLIISRVRFEHVVPGTYVVFALSFFAFYAGSGFAPDPTVIDKIFYVWLSVFSLFHASVFWSFMSGTFSRKQAPRLFAIIASGAALGSIAGSAVAGFLGEDIGLLNLLLIAAVLILATLPIIRVLRVLKVTELGNRDLSADLSEAKRLGRNPFSGFLLFIRNPYLVAIGVFILMYVAMSTFVYMELRELLAAYERDERTEILGRIDFWVNIAVVLIALFGTGRMATRFGMAATLSLIPFLMIGGWLIVAALPLLGVLYGLQFFRKAGNYAVTKPGREMLFTLVDDESRYKAKPVIDIVVYRGGDSVTAWLHTALRELFGLGLGGVALVAALLAGIWALAGIYLGRIYEDAKE